MLIKDFFTLSTAWDIKRLTKRIVTTVKSMSVLPWLTASSAWAMDISFCSRVSVVLT